MFEKFQDYMWYLLHAPFKKNIKKEESDVFKLFKAIGKIIDNLKETIFLLRRQAMIMTAHGKALDMHGRDRKMPRYIGETDEQYRKRLLMKREIAERAGTKYGIIKALESIGYEHATIEPVPSVQGAWFMDGEFLLNGTRKMNSIDTDSEHWSEFMVFLNTDNQESLEDFRIVQKTVRDVKQASSLPVYGWRAVIENENFFDTLMRHRPSIIINNVVGAKLINCIDIDNENSISVNLRTEFNLWLLDGSYNLDGLKILNAEILDEVM